MAAPSVYAAINAVSAELAKAGIAKTHVNAVDDYKYRSIDDLLDRLAPLLARHRLCVLPRVLDRHVVERTDEGERLLFHVAVRIAFTLTSVEDGSGHDVEAYGEALDASDKATAKAMSAAYKSAMIQTFCIPFSGSEDADKAGPRVSTRTHVAEPVQGWEQWARDIEDIVCLCESEAGISHVQERNRELLKSVGRERPDIYRELGDAFGARRQALQERSATTAKKRQTSRKPAEKIAQPAQKQLAGVAAERESEDA